MDMSEPLLDAWRPLSKAIELEPSNEIFREARGHMALKLISMDVPDIPGLVEPRSAAVEDWEFLVTNVYNSRDVFGILEKAYDHARVPKEARLPSPPE